MGKLSFINQTIRKNAKELALQSSCTGYHKFWKGISKNLTFSKSPDSNIEDVYAKHYVGTKQMLELKKLRQGVNPIH